MLCSELVSLLARRPRRATWSLLLFCSVLVALVGAPLRSQGGGPPLDSRAAWMPDRGDGTYLNPVLFADYSDPDVVRSGDDFFLVASSFHEAPGLPVLQSRDLVNWTIVGHAAERLPSPVYGEPQHGKGVWAPAIRHHDGLFWVFFGDPDLGLFMTRARDPRGPWEPLHLVVAARGLIDPCPLWDDDGRLYLVHAWAKSRAGVNGILTLRRLSPDGRKALDDGVTVFDWRGAASDDRGAEALSAQRLDLHLRPGGGREDRLADRSPFAEHPRAVRGPGRPRAGRDRGQRPAPGGSRRRRPTANPGSSTSRIAGRTAG